MKEYILIDSVAVCLEVFTRQEDNRWILAEYRRPGDSFYISTIGLSLSLADIYDDVGFNE